MCALPIPHGRLQILFTHTRVDELNWERDKSYLDNFLHLILLKIPPL